MNKVDYSTIEPDRRGDGVWLVQYGSYEETSVLAGQPFRQLAKHYPTVEEAQAENPDAEVREYCGYLPPVYIPHTPPSWFDELDAGERWDDDY